VFPESSIYKQMQSLHAGAKTPSMASRLTAIAMRTAIRPHPPSRSVPLPGLPIQDLVPLHGVTGDFRLAFFN